jgi:glycolate oxidase iron-sulfur subunit
MKQVLEGAEPTRATQLHLDRCLTCRNCESTCPSGVDYGHLVDIGRKLVDAKVPRPVGERLVRWALKEGLPSPLFGPAMALGQWVRPLLPKVLQDKVPAKTPSGVYPKRTHARKVLMLAGCVQPAMAPNINSATARVLDAAGIQAVVASKAGCCGAVKFHLNDQDGGKREMRANIDAWWPYIASEQGDAAVEAILMNASGCGVTVKEYGHILRDDPYYADKAARVSALTQDLSEYLPTIVDALCGKLNPDALGALVFHPPCTLQHGQQLRGGVEQHMQALGFTVRLASRDAHLCCGSAGTYSVLQPALSKTLRSAKLAALQAQSGEVIISANIGCITHLQSGTQTPVRHWVEVLDQALEKGG